MIRVDTSIRNITVSGRIASGSTTLARSLSKQIGWKLLEGGELFEKFHSSIQTTESDVDTRPDKIDLEYEQKVKNILAQQKNQIIQSHLAGFDAQGINGVFKILVVCEDGKGNDVPSERMKRLVERKNISFEEAEKEIVKREEGNLEKWRRLYAKNDPKWVYWDKRYYNFTINTFYLNQQETLEKTLAALTSYEGIM